MREIFNIFIVSMKVIFISSFISLIISFFISFLILDKKLKFLFLFFQSFLFIPSVLIYIIFKRSGIFGFLNLLYTSKIIIIGETILIIPLMGLFIVNGIKDRFYEIEEINEVFCGNFLKNLLLMIKEFRNELLSSFFIGCGRVIGETGLVMIVGGNIKGETRTFSTSIVLYTMRGEIEKSIHAGILLFAFSLIFNLFYFFNSRKWKYF
jgi:tungstate transport system permease protein